MSAKPVVLIILDGWGVAPPGPGNAISLARKPFWDKISLAYPHTNLLASGESVGLPAGTAGNSEVGHLNIGAGMIVCQELVRINMKIADGSFLENPAFLAASDHVKKHNSSLHLLGLVGTGSVHSHLEHLYSLLWFAKTRSIKKVYIHAFTDGRDSSPTDALGTIHNIQTKISEIGVGKLASICGRYYAMDRVNRWRRTQKAYELLVKGVGEKGLDPLKAVSDSYQKGITDEFLEPTLVSEDKEARIKPDDSVIFFNFRPDRARQLTKSFVMPSFNDFPRESFLQNIVFVTMTDYEKDLPVLTAFPPPRIDYPLAAVLSLHEKRQLHIGETEKYAHVTYFLNGGKEEPYPGEDRVHIPSPKVATYDKKPEMSAPEITDYMGKTISQNLYDCIIINFANADMVAHTGSLSATKKAIETLDSCLEKITNLVLASNGIIVIIGDHGNAEVMTDPKTNAINTEHSVNPVPFIVVGKSFLNSSNIELPVGLLADVAPTILFLLKIQKPGTMTGNNLLA